MHLYAPVHVYIGCYIGIFVVKVVTQKNYEKRLILMDGFIKTRTGFLKRDAVSTVEKTRDLIVLTAKDGKQYSIPVTDDTMDEIWGRKNIIQVIPNKDMFVLYDNPNYPQYDDDEYKIESLKYLALCADGKIRGLELHNGHFNLIDSRDYGVNGFYSKQELETLGYM